MSNTKSINKEFEHHEIEIRTVMQDSLSFIHEIKSKKYHKLRSHLIILLRLAMLAVMYLTVCVVGMAMAMLDIGKPEVIAFSLIAGLVIVRLFSMTTPRYKNIKYEEVIECVADSTLPLEEGKEKIAFYNFGEEGFSTNSYYMQTETVFHRYKDLARAIEFKKGIVMIYQDKLNGTRIYCIPSRFFYEEAEDFLIERLKKKLGRRYKFEDTMETLLDDNGNYIL